LLLALGTVLANLACFVGLRPAKPPSPEDAPLAGLAPLLERDQNGST
jgi:hypothetical protein